MALKNTILTNLLLRRTLLALKALRARANACAHFVAVGVGLLFADKQVLTVTSLRWPRLPPHRFRRQEC
jgi:hypothetical protein